MRRRKRRIMARKRKDAADRIQTGGGDGATIDELSVRNADDPSLGLTNVGNRPPEDWAADTGPTRAAESSGGESWDPLRSQVHPTRASEAPIGVLAREAPQNLQECLIQELQDLYQAESEQTRVLGELERAASAEDLKSAFQDHLTETQQHVERLSQILELLGESAGGSGTVPAVVVGLIEESREKLEQQTNSGLRDLAIIAEAQKMEHNEMACYGTARAIAHTLGRDQEAHLLQSTLTEEEQADKKLTQIALRLLKQVGADAEASCEYNPEPA